MKTLLMFMKRFTVAVSFLFGFIAFASHAHAQEKSGEVLQQLERKELMPEKKPPLPPVIEKEEKPKIEFKDEEKIFVKRIRVEGASLIDEQTIHSLIESFENKELTLEDISTAAMQQRRSV